MFELHPIECACRGCRSRRLICGDDQATERYSADELEDFGYVLERKQGGQEDR